MQIMVVAETQPGQIRTRKFELPRYIFTVVRSAITSVEKKVDNLELKSALIRSLQGYLPYADVNSIPTDESVILKTKLFTYTMLGMQRYLHEMSRIHQVKNRC
jgi:hypothetical protein